MKIFEEPLVYLKGALVFVLGPLTYHLAYLGVVILVDLFFGMRVAVKERTFKWKLMYTKVLTKVTTYAAIIVMFHALDQVIGLPDTARWSVIVILLGTEMVSAIKNTSKLGYGKLADQLENIYLTLIKQKGGSADAKPSTPTKRKRKEASGSDSDSV